MTIELETTAVGDLRSRDVELVGVLPRVAVGKRADDVVGWSFFASLGSPCGMRG